MVREPDSPVAPATEWHPAVVFPLFVTWNKRSSSGSGRMQLRGCIGSLQPRPLQTGLKDYALTSALRDSRFSPISLREVPSLSCGVSLLSNFELADDCYDWTVGMHGLLLEFSDPVLGCRRSATFLPEVALEQQWTQEQCIDALIRKAGFNGPVTEKLRSALKLTRYRSTKAMLMYADYAAQRELQHPGAHADAVATGSPTTMVPA